ncbi:unnamed protein product [Rotaria socialis]|uniref:Uncharacterized protein n=1 Tax=Rotaria socialis TaxID=392032 RepID=A0A821FCU4_9BILA|nr:unnamed protein product [Rotaria socialis]
MRSFPLDVAGQLPQSETLLRTIRRQLQGPPMNSNNQLPDHLKQTDRGENFVLHEDEKLIIFTTATNLSVLKTCLSRIFLSNVYVTWIVQITNYSIGLWLTHVIKAFNLIADDFEDEADDFLGYFEKTWIGQPKKRGTGQKKTLFPIDRAVANLPRSNNSIEG